MSRQDLHRCNFCELHPRVGVAPGGLSEQPGRLSPITSDSEVIYTTAGGALANLLHKMTDDEDRSKLLDRLRLPVPRSSGARQDTANLGGTQRPERQNMHGRCHMRPYCRVPNRQRTEESAVTAIA